MRSFRGRGLPTGKSLLHALGVWLLSALILTCAAALLVNAFGLRETQLGYVESLISFFAAFFAGSTAVRRGNSGRLLTALVAGTSLVVVLLTLGFLAGGKGFDPSSILSVVSFSYAGCFAGALLYQKRMNKDRRNVIKRKLT